MISKTKWLVKARAGCLESPALLSSHKWDANRSPGRNSPARSAVPGLEQGCTWKCEVGEMGMGWASAGWSLAGLGRGLRLRYGPHKLRNNCHYVITPKAEYELEERHNRKDIVFEISWMFSNISPSVFIYLEIQFHQNWVQSLQRLPLLAQSRLETMSQYLEGGC